MKNKNILLLAGFIVLGTINNSILAASITFNNTLDIEVTVKGPKKTATIPANANGDTMNTAGSGSSSCTISAPGYSSITKTLTTEKTYTISAKDNKLIVT